MPELQDPDIFRTILESLQTGVYVVGREGRILFWNQGAEKITGYCGTKRWDDSAARMFFLIATTITACSAVSVALLPVLCTKESRVKVRFTFGIRRGTGFPSICGLWLFVIPTAP